MSAAFEMTIEEREGLLRQVILRGRSLPFQGVPFGTQQRVDINYFGGNPVAESQVSGPVWTDTDMRGRWSDLYLFDDTNAATLIGFPALQSQAQPGGLLRAGASFKSGGTVPDQMAKTARAVRDAIYKITRSGALLRVEWASIVRFGYIYEFTPTHIREEDIEWEMQFQWTGDTENQPVPAPQSTDVTSLIRQILDIIDQVLDVAQSPLFVLEGFQRLVSQSIIRLGQIAEELIGTLERLVQFTLLPVDLFGTLKASFKGIQLAANDLVAVFKELSAAVATTDDTGGDPAQVAFDNGIQLAIRKLLIRLAAEGRIAQEAIAKFDSPEVMTVITTPVGITLRDISLDQYGTAQNWKAIQDFNGFPTSVVPVGTLVRVPVI